MKGDDVRWFDQNVKRKNFFMGFVVTTDLGLPSNQPLRFTIKDFPFSFLTSIACFLFSIFYCPVFFCIAWRFFICLLPVCVFYSEFFIDRSFFYIFIAPWLLIFVFFYCLAVGHSTKCFLRNDHLK